MRRFLILIALLFLVSLLAGCTGGFGGWGWGQNNNQYYDASRARFYEGPEGVEMRLQQIPREIYFHGDAIRTVANDFELTLEIKNMGASYSRGGIFLSGYNPHMIHFDEVDVPTSYPGACTLRIGDYHLNKLGATIFCQDDFYASFTEDGWLRAIRARGVPWFDNKILNDIIIDYRETAGGDHYLDFVFDDVTFTFERWQNGLMLMGMLAGLSFQKFLGQEYLLAADNYDYPGGELDYFGYHGHIVSWDQGVDIIPQTFLFTNCYMYTTFAAPIVCIDPQPYVENRKVCHPSQASWSNGQGAPVAVTRVIQENTPRKAVFHITVQNVGGGTVFDPGSLEKCSPYYPGGAKPADLNILWIGQIRIGEWYLDCTPEAVIRMQNGRAEFTCTYDIQYAEINSAYETPLTIELWYGYSEILERRVNLKRVS